MKTIAVLSDTHGNLSALEGVLPILSSCDMVFHLGDCFTDMRAFKGELGDKLVCVKGNCDIHPESKYKIVEVEGKRLLLTHGDCYGVKAGLTRLCYFAKEQGVDAVFFGHTHVACDEEADGVRFINPGALSLMTVEKSFAYVVIKDGKILCNHNKNVTSHRRF